MSRFFNSPDVRLIILREKHTRKVSPDMLKTKKKIKNNEIFIKVWAGPMIYSRMFLSPIRTKRSQNASLAKI